MNLLYGMPTMIACLFLQSVLVLLALRFYDQRMQRMPTLRFGTLLIALNGVMFVLIFGITIQVGLWAWLFMYLGEFDNFDVAAYHSGVNFATLGYGDIIMSEKYRFLAPLQAINGMLMIGISTATLLSTVDDALTRTTGKSRTLKR